MNSSIVNCINILIISRSIKNIISPSLTNIDKFGINIGCCFLLLAKTVQLKFQLTVYYDNQIWEIY